MKAELKVVYVDVTSLLDEVQKKEVKEYCLNTEMAILLPKGYEPRLRVLASTMQSLIDRSNMGKELGISQDLCIEFQKLWNSFNYLLNSTSYSEGTEYFGFDKMEVNSKLGRR